MRINSNSEQIRKKSKSPFLKLLILATLIQGCSQETKVSQKLQGEFREEPNEYITPHYGSDGHKIEVNLISRGHNSLITKCSEKITSTYKGKNHLTTAVRCISPATTSITAMVIWQLNPNETPQILSKINISDTEWHDISTSLPKEGGIVSLVTTPETPANEGKDLPEIAWQKPVWGDANGSKSPDVCLISIDTFRSSALHAAPYLSQLLSEGRSYINAYSPSNWTLPAFASLATGLLPEEHNVVRNEFSANATNRYEDRKFSALKHHPTIAEALSAAGYVTAFVHQNPFLESWTQLQKGFHLYARTSDKIGSSDNLINTWWSNHRKSPRFLLAHFMEPHWPYSDRPLFEKDIKEFLTKDMTPNQRQNFFTVTEEKQNEIQYEYLNQIKKLDKYLESFIEGLKKTSRNLIIIIHVDHGEELFDHGSFEHGHSFADCIIKVPLGIIHSGEIRSEQIGTPVPAHHIGTYLLEYLNIKSELPPSALGENPNADKRVVSTHSLYRSNIGGKKINKDGSYSIIEQSKLTWANESASIPIEVLHALEELGYAGDNTYPERK